MAVNRCSTCSLHYPTSYGGLCLECDGKLDRISNSDEKVMSEQEFNERRERVRLRKGDEPKALSEADQRALDKDLEAFVIFWDALEGEAARRGPRWTAMDIWEEQQTRGKIA